MSYWEQWPSPTGYAPRTANLFRLAQLLCCRIADLVGDAGDFRHLDPQHEQAELFDVCRSCGQFAPAPWDSTIDALRRLAEVRQRLAAQVRNAESALRDLDDLSPQAGVWTNNARNEMSALVALLA